MTEIQIYKILQHLQQQPCPKGKALRQEAKLRRALYRVFEEQFSINLCIFLRETRKPIPDICPAQLRQGAAKISSLVQALYWGGVFYTPEIWVSLIEWTRLKGDKLHETVLQVSGNNSMFKLRVRWSAYKGREMRCKITADPALPAEALSALQDLAGNLTP